MSDTKLTKQDWVHLADLVRAGHAKLGALASMEHFEVLEKVEAIAKSKGWTPLRVR